MTDLLIHEVFEARNHADTMVKFNPFGDQGNDLPPSLSDSLKYVVCSILIQLKNEEITWRSAATSLEKAGVPLEIICTTLLPYSGKFIGNDVDRRRKPNQRELVDFVISLLNKEGLSWSSAAVLLDNADISVATICRVLSSYRSK